MKENPIIRAAILVLVLILLSTCCIGGTFAKYTTGALGGDSARVAIWGITKDFAAPDENGDTMFKAQYADTVSSADKAHVVAPGTTKSYVYGLKGTPEVAYNVYIGLTDTTDMALHPGTYTFAPPYEDMTVEVAETYFPLVWTVQITTTNGTLTGDFANGTLEEFESLAQVSEALKTVTVSYNSGASCDVRVELAWTWDFEESQGVHSNQDRMDTVLGYYISQAEGKITDLPFTTTGESADTTVGYTFTLTAVQVD